MHTREAAPNAPSPLAGEGVSPGLDPGLTDEGSRGNGRVADGILQAEPPFNPSSDLLRRPPSPARGEGSQHARQSLRERNQSPASALCLRDTGEDASHDDFRPDAGRRPGLWTGRGGRPATLFRQSRGRGPDGGDPAVGAGAGARGGDGPLSQRRRRHPRRAGRGNDGPAPEAGPTDHGGVPAHTTAFRRTLQHRHLRAAGRTAAPGLGKSLAAQRPACAAMGHRA
jgi:hypothetical protein